MNRIWFVRISIMDKSWMRLEDKLCNEYLKGVNEFMKAAKKCADENNCVCCPCKKCLNAVRCSQSSESGEVQSFLDFFRSTHYNEKNGWISYEAQSAHVSFLYNLIYFEVINFKIVYAFRRQKHFSQQHYFVAKNGL